MSSELTQAAEWPPDSETSTQAKKEGRKEEEERDWGTDSEEFVLLKGL